MNDPEDALIFVAIDTNQDAEIDEAELTSMKQLMDYQDDLNT